MLTCSEDLELMKAGGTRAIHVDRQDTEGLGLGGGQGQREVHEGVKLAGGRVALGAHQGRLEESLQ